MEAGIENPQFIKWKARAFGAIGTVALAGFELNIMAEEYFDGLGSLALSLWAGSMYLRRSLQASEAEHFRNMLTSEDSE